MGEGSALVALVTAVSGREVWVADTEPEPGLKYEPATLDRLRVVESEEEAEAVRSRWGRAEGEAEGRRYMLDAGWESRLGCVSTFSGWVVGCQRDACIPVKQAEVRSET